MSGTKAGATYPGGFQSNEGGFQYTNSFPDNSRYKWQNLVIIVILMGKAGTLRSILNNLNAQYSR